MRPLRLIGLAAIVGAVGLGTGCGFLTEIAHSERAELDVRLENQLIDYHVHILYGGLDFASSDTLLDTATNKPANSRIRTIQGVAKGSRLFFQAVFEDGRPIANVTCTWDGQLRLSSYLVYLVGTTPGTLHCGNGLTGPNN